MNRQVLALLCDPETRDPFELLPGGLRNAVTGRVYPMRQGIPIFISTLMGPNLRHQLLYDRLARGYDLAERMRRFFSFGTKGRREMLRQLEISPGARVLEISAGVGANLRYMPSDIEFFGVDLSFGMLRRCARNMRRWHRTAELFQGEAERLPFCDCTFDRVFNARGINHLTDPGAAIGEMIRVAKPGARIVIVDDAEAAPAPRRAVPEGETDQETEAAGSLKVSDMQDVQVLEICDGKFICLSFWKPYASGESDGGEGLKPQSERRIG